jgi:hypothetical protein
VKREKELHWEILAFSVSHDNQKVKIDGHYPVMDKEKNEFELAVMVKRCFMYSISKTAFIQ